MPMTGRLAPPWHWIFPHLASLEGRAEQTARRGLEGAEARGLGRGAGGGEAAPRLALGEGARGVFAAVAVGVARGVDPLEADPGGRLRACEGSRAASGAPVAPHLPRNRSGRPGLGRSALSGGLAPWFRPTRQQLAPRLLLAKHTFPSSGNKAWPDPGAREGGGCQQEKGVLVLPASSPQPPETTRAPAVCTEWRWLVWGSGISHALQPV